MLDEEVPLILGRLAVLGPDDAGRPVQVEHVDELLLLLLQLLDLSLQVGVNRLELLRLLQRREEKKSVVSLSFDVNALLDKILCTLGYLVTKKHKE